LGNCVFVCFGVPLIGAWVALIIAALIAWQSILEALLRLVPGPIVDNSSAAVDTPAGVHSENWPSFTLFG
jgi:hypothetical protein